MTKSYAAGSGNFLTTKNSTASAIFMSRKNYIPSNEKLKATMKMNSYNKNYFIKIVFGDMIKEISAEQGSLLLNILNNAGFSVFAYCGGLGVCGNCYVFINGETELACAYRIENDVTVVLTDTEFNYCEKTDSKTDSETDFKTDSKTDSETDSKTNLKTNSKAALKTSFIFNLGNND